MFKNLKRAGIFFIAIVSLYFSLSVKVSAYDLDASQRAYTSNHYYSDGTYEYATGITYLMDNKTSGGSANNLSASTPQIQKDTDPGQHAVWNRFRDMWTVYSSYGKVTTNVNDPSNFDGWSFYSAEWATQTAYNKYCLSANFYSDYISNTDWNDLNSVMYGIETAPPGQYFYGGGVANKYRRPVFIIFRRKLPQPRLGNTYLSEINGDTPSYEHETTLWKRSGNYRLRTWSYDAYEGMGQYPQYSGGIKDSYLDINKVNPDGTNSVHTQIKMTRNNSSDYTNYTLRNDANVPVSSVGRYGGETTKISNPNSYGHSTGYTYRNTGFGLYFGVENNMDYRLYASARNKQGFNLVGGGNGNGMYSSSVTGDGANWLGGFKQSSDYNAKTYNWLRIDDDAPIVNDIPEEGAKIDRTDADDAYEICPMFADNRSGFKYAEIRDNDNVVASLYKSFELDNNANLY